jgi:RHH-type proline utilization regulon transcriptional repressor/proline dehydrogenase/delta 1-pyrroline-5-carboxylate dehydrogenase
MDCPAGEQNLLGYQGRGPAVIIAPWNFPLAILCGMATAALAAGNTVILKPAEQSPATAYLLFQAMLEAGIPAESVQFLPAKGEEVGPLLVGHPQVAQIAFTGSFAVGTGILRSAAEVKPGQRQLKRVVCEMGGKNAILVDEDADLDEAVAGVAKSAFGFAGQKCSAASRVIAVGDIFPEFLKRFLGHCRLLKVGSAIFPDCDIPPVIDDEALARIRALVENPGAGAKLLYAGAPSGGRCAGPLVFQVPGPDHRLMQEEFFGPVIAAAKADSFEQALEWALATPYALTGAIYSRSPSRIEEAKRRFRVGNLYVNRSSTGAVVGRQPFGGFGHSGLGTKAGGPGYLRLFADPYCVTENTMRHGFTPDIQD